MKTFSISLLFAFIALNSFGQQGTNKESINKEQYEKLGKQYEDMAKQMLSGMSKVTTRPEYRFSISVKQHVVSYNNGAVNEEKDIKYYLNNDKKIFAMDGSQMTNNKKQEHTNMISVFDNENSAMLMFNLDEKTLLAMNLNAFKDLGNMAASKVKPVENKTPKNESPDCNKTGKTKTIIGYSCYEYSCKTEGEKGHSSFWISNDPKLGNLNYMAGKALPAAAEKYYGFSGTMMGIDMYDEKGLTSSMTVTEINKSENLKIVTADFKQQPMPSFGN